MKLLLVDDDPTLTDVVSATLTRQNYTVDVARDGLTGWEYIQAHSYDLILLDVMLPDGDGVSLCQKMREEGYQIPILLLTACDTSLDKVRGLDAGADDYVVKPFDWEELLARIRALLRRETMPLPAVLEWGALRLNPANGDVSYDGKPLMLRPREYQLLELFLRHPNRVFSSGAILEHLWSFEDLPGEETVRAHVKGLRHKLKQVGAEDALETVYGLGYRLKPLAPDLKIGEPEADSREVLPVAESGHATKADKTEADKRMTAQLQEALAIAWKEIQPGLLQRIYQVTTQLHQVREGASPLELRQQMAAEVHRLIGTIGAFGFHTAIQQCRQIEAVLLEEPTLLLASECKAIEKGLVQIQRALQAPLEQIYPVETAIVPPAAIPQKMVHSTITQATLLIVEDDTETLHLLQKILEPWGFNLSVLTDSTQIWPALETTIPDLLLLDGDMLKANGLTLCQSLRDSSRWASLPIIFLTGDSALDAIQQVFAAGADDFVTKPIIAPELVSRIQSRIDRARFWRRLVETDSLTQLANRTKFSQEVQQMLDWATKQIQPVALVLLSLNQLKQINRQYGYATGDVVLCKTGQLLHQHFHEVGLVARWSGSQFVLALQGCDRATAERHLQPIVITLQQEGIPIPNVHPSLPVSLRYGIAQYPQDSVALQMLYQIAEEAIETALLPASFT
jgi:diguanylate cyclase (GGDEF)-like protein